VTALALSFDAPTLSPPGEITPEQWAAYKQYAQDREAVGKPIPADYDARLLAASPYEHDRALAAWYVRLTLRGEWRPPRERVNKKLVARHARKKAARKAHRA